MWARKHVGTDRCPKSEITAQSIEWLEKFVVWRQFGASYPEPLSARDVEAFLLLERELKLEGNHG